MLAPAAGEEVAWPQVTEHKIKFTHITKPSEAPFHHARCLACGDTSGPQATKQMAEDWGNTHQDKMERLKLNIRGHGTAEGDLRYYQQMAERTEGALSDQWQALADELNRRLHAVDHRYSEDVPLELP